MQRNSLRRYLNKIADKYRGGHRTNDYPAGKGIDTPVFVETVNDKWHSKEESHREGEKKYWNRYLILNFLILVATGSAAFFAFLAYCQTKRQADIAYEAFIENDRPIVVINVHGSADAPNFVISNVGSKPAYIEMIQMRIDIGGKVPLTESLMPDECHSELGMLVIKSGDSFSGTCSKKNIIHTAEKSSTECFSIKV